MKRMFSKGQIEQLAKEISKDSVHLYQVTGTLTDSNEDVYNISAYLITKSELKFEDGLPVNQDMLFIAMELNNDDTGSNYFVINAQAGWMSDDIPTICTDDGLYYNIHAEEWLFNFKVELQ